MGLLRHLVLLPLAPVEGVVWVARQIQTQVDRELTSPDALWAELAELQVAADDGRIDADEYAAAEAEILDRLEALEAMDDLPAADSSDGTDPVETMV